MLTIIFFVALIGVVWKMFVFGLKATWGIAKLICTVILLPVILIGLVCAGLLYIAFPVLIIVGIVMIIKGAAKV
ncbi:MAG: hypothetical protein HDQ96_07220 [Lachnospiraceae bacterium]|nr:hypothetical protein [Lachnospiraceae bacterium]